MKREAVPQETVNKEAAALRPRWDRKRSKITQDQFGDKYDLGTQGNVGHYLNAKQPLNVRAAMAFAAELECAVRDFSPRLADQIERFGAAPPWPFPQIDPARWTRLPRGEKTAIAGRVLGEIEKWEDSQGTPKRLSPA